MSIVVGLIVHCDSQWIPMRQLLTNLLTRVPPQYRENFYFHGKTLLAENQYQDWDIEERRKLMCDVMCIPRMLRVPVAIGAVRRNSPNNPYRDLKGMGSGEFLKKLSRAEYDHSYAFLICMAKADEYVRTNCGNELAQVIADDLPTSNIKKALQFSVDALRYGPPMKTNWTRRALGKPVDVPVEYSIHRIVDEVNFSDERKSAHLQIADACAYGLRRMVARKSGGDDFLAAIAGGVAIDLAQQSDFYGAVISYKEPELNVPVLILPR